MCTQATDIKNIKMLISKIAFKPTFERSYPVGHKTVNNIPHYKDYW